MRLPVFHVAVMTKMRLAETWKCLFSMRSPQVCYVAHDISTPPIEGHHVASKRIIVASVRAGLISKTYSIESNAVKESNQHDIVAVKSVIRPIRGKLWFVPGAASALNDFLSLAQMLMRIKHENPDIIHVLNVNKEAYLAVHRLLHLNKPLLLHFFHSPYVMVDDIFRIRNLTFKAGFYKGSDIHFLAVNHSLLRYFIEKTGANSGNVHFVPYPVDTDRFKPLDKAQIRKKHAVPSDRPVVAYVGALAPSRGLFNLMRLLPSCVKSVPDLLLYISHPQREGEEIYEASLNRLIKRLGLQKNVTITGAFPNVEEIYNLADVVTLPFIRPYWVDPPLVLLEAMSCGAAIVTSPVGAADEVILDNDNGILAKTEEEGSWTQSVMGLLENLKKSKRMGQKARETILQKYSYDAVGSNLLKTYYSVLDQYNGMTNPLESLRHRKGD